MNKVIFTDSEKIEILDKYVNQKIPAKYIAKMFCVCSETIINLLKENKVFHNNRISLLPEIIQEMKNQYLNLNLNFDEIADNFGFSRAFIYNTLKRNGVKFKGFKKIPISVNENYFEKIDTPNKAYFLGLLYADGTILTPKNRQKRMKISLKSTDKYILEKFKDELNYQGKIHLSVIERNVTFKATQTRKIRQNLCYTSRMSTLIVSSEKLCCDLIKLGCVPRKSLILKFPTYEQVPKHLIPHFIRGNMDGDGWVTSPVNKKFPNSSQLVIGFLGTFDFVSKLRNHILLDINIKASEKSIMKYENIFKLTYSGNLLCKNIYYYLYNNAELFLERKKIKFERIFRKYKDFIPLSFP